MPPSPAGGRKGRTHSDLVGGGVPTPRQQHLGFIKRRANSQAGADSPDVVPCRGCCCAERASPFPTGGRVRFRHRWAIEFGAAARRAGDGVPYGAYADSPEVKSKLRRMLRGRRGRRPLQITTPIPVPFPRWRKDLERYSNETAEGFFGLPLFHVQLSCCLPARYSAASSCSSSKSSPTSTTWGWRR